MELSNNLQTIIEECSEITCRYKVKVFESNDLYKLAMLRDCIKENYDLDTLCNDDFYKSKGANPMAMTEVLELIKSDSSKSILLVDGPIYALHTWSSNLRRKFWNEMSYYSGKIILFFMPEQEESKEYFRICENIINGCTVLEPKRIKGGI